MTMLALLIGVAIMPHRGLPVSVFQQSLAFVHHAQVRRTEAMIAGMTDAPCSSKRRSHGSLNGRAATILPRDIGIPIFEHPSAYICDGKRATDRRDDCPPRARWPGKPVRTRRDHRSGRSPDRHRRQRHSAARGRPALRWWSPSATSPSAQARRGLQLQAERAQIWRAGAFFSSNIDPVWVTQAIAERIAEVLGDGRVILKTPGSHDMRVPRSITATSPRSPGLATSTAAAHGGRGHHRQLVATWISVADDEHRQRGVGIAWRPT